jgi:hypothetical protein
LTHPAQHENAGSQEPECLEYRILDFSIDERKWPRRFGTPFALSSCVLKKDFKLWEWICGPQ